MKKREVIENFALQRPASIATFGYGSGVFKQSVSENNKPMTDVIFVVEDIQKWHLENMKMNPSDYSFIGRIHLNRKSVSKIKGKNKITYFSEIRENGCIFKYGVIEIEDFIHGLGTWENIFIAGRFHKPVMDIKSTLAIDRVLCDNRSSALFIAALFSPSYCTISSLYETLCGLSYMGDARMAIAENPKKVENIVRGSFDHFMALYPLCEDYIQKIDGYRVYIKYDVLLSRLDELPASLYEYLVHLDIDLTDLRLVNAAIREYLLDKNKEESRAQILEGIKTNGIVRSIPYALAKVKKRFVR